MFRMKFITFDNASDNNVVAVYIVFLPIRARVTMVTIST